MTRRPPTRDTLDYRDEPLYWFALLEISRKRGDFEQAAEAKHELKRLGVSVSYARRVRKYLPKRS